MEAAKTWVESITRKKAQYCRYLDTKQWDELEGLMLSDAHLSFLNTQGEVFSSGGIRYRFNSPRDFTRTMRKVFKTAKTSHSVTNPELELVSDQQAKAVWAMRDCIIFPDIAGFIPVSMRGYGHYFETWSKVGEDWFLSDLELRRTIVDFSLVARLFSRSNS